MASELEKAKRELESSRSELMTVHEGRTKTTEQLTELIVEQQSKIDEFQNELRDKHISEENFRDELSRQNEDSVKWQARCKVVAAEKSDLELEIGRLTARIERSASTEADNQRLGELLKSAESSWHRETAARVKAEKERDVAERRCEELQAIIESFSNHNHEPELSSSAVKSAKDASGTNNNSATEIHRHKKLSTAKSAGGYHSESSDVTMRLRTRKSSSKNSDTDHDGKRDAYQTHGYLKPTSSSTAKSTTRIGSGTSSGTEGDTTAKKNLIFGYLGEVQRKAASALATLLVEELSSSQHEGNRTSSSGTNCCDTIGQDLRDKLRHLQSSVSGAAVVDNDGSNGGYHLSGATTATANINSTRGGVDTTIDSTFSGDDDEESSSSSRMRIQRACERASVRLLSPKCVRFHPSGELMTTINSSGNNLRRPNGAERRRTEGDNRGGGNGVGSSGDDDDFDDRLRRKPYSSIRRRDGLNVVRGRQQQQELEGLSGIITSEDDDDDDHDYDTVDSEEGEEEEKYSQSSAAAAMRSLRRHQREVRMRRRRMAAKNTSSQGGGGMSLLASLLAEAQVLLLPSNIRYDTYYIIWRSADLHYRSTIRIALALLRLFGQLLL
jgi:hypothetical protein